jgi:hypothetical protein
MQDSDWDPWGEPSLVGSAQLYFYFYFYFYINSSGMIVISDRDHKKGLFF